MTPTPHDRIVLALGIVAGAVILAIVALLASGSFRATAAPRAVALAQPSGTGPSAGERLQGPASTQAAPLFVPQPTGGIGTALLGGYATYFDTCAGCAAAGPVLREALGSKWRGTDLAVCTPVACVDVVLTDWCQCRDRHGAPTLIDLDRESFARLAPVSDGIVAVSIELPIELPRTDADQRMMREVLGDELYR